MSISSKLGSKDKKALAHFYETETHDSLKKLLKLVKANAANQALKSQNHETTKWLQGQAYTCDQLTEELKRNHERDQKT